MATIKIGCPKCNQTGLIGTVRESVCDECTGTGTITANSTDTIATISAASQVAVIVTVPQAVPVAALKVASKGK